MPFDAPHAAHAQLEALVKRFEQAWHAGQRPAIEDYLAGASSVRTPLVCELVHADLEFRLRAGDAVRVEEYLQRFPELARDAEAVVELGAAEFHLRQRRGQSPLPAEYLARFPQYRERLETPLSPLEPTEAAPGTEPHKTPQLPALIGRYQVGRSIAHGGMGDVLRVLDTDFDRPLAMKVLQSKYVGDAAMEQRFLREARLTGQLQHPGIPPVQERGRLPDGRPYFIMKLVKGRDLQAALRQRAALADQQNYYLGVFEQICRTVGYAHARGIIHRDLKPANIMVGAFGEVQVMDWGLAKVLPLSPLADDTALPATSSTIYHVRSATPPNRESVAGTVIGTPAYMAPEQARGEVEKLDASCDVFGLGGILCEMLTGQPPFAGSALDNERRAMKGDLSEPFSRLDGSGADAEVIALARRCLAAEPRDRPADAGEVAQAMAAYQELVRERLRQAEVAKAQAQVRAEEEHKRLLVERQKRRLTVALAGAMLLVLTAGIAGSVLGLLHQAEVERKKDLAEAGVRQALDQAEQGRAELHAILQKPGGVFELLNDPARWKARIDSARKPHSRPGARPDGDCRAWSGPAAVRGCGQAGRALAPGRGRPPPRRAPGKNPHRRGHARRPPF